LHSPGDAGVANCDWAEHSSGTCSRHDSETTLGGDTEEQSTRDLLSEDHGFDCDEEWADKFSFVERQESNGLLSVDGEQRVDDLWKQRALFEDLPFAFHPDNFLDF